MRIVRHRSRLRAHRLRLRGDGRTPSSPGHLRRHHASRGRRRFPIVSRGFIESWPLFAKTRPDCVAVESVFHAVNAAARSSSDTPAASRLLAAVEAGCAIVEYTPAEVKRAVVGYGRADKRQVQQMIKLLLGLAQPPSPYDAADALAVAICHLHSGRFGRRGSKERARRMASNSPRRQAASWHSAESASRPPAHG